MPASFVVAAVASAMLRPIPPAHDAGGLSAWQSTKEGLRYLRSRQALQGVYLIDINAMVFGMPRALFPAMAGDRLRRRHHHPRLPLRRARRGRAHRGA